MKKYLVFLFFTFNCWSQQVEVPFKIDGKYTFSDYNGKIISNIKLDYIGLNRNYPKGFFYFSDLINKENGIVTKDKIILSGIDYDEFDFFEKKFIIAHARDVSTDVKNFNTEEEYKNFKKHRNYKSLFNINGVNVYPDNFRRIIPIDTIGVSSKNKMESRFSLLLVQDFEERGSLIIYDNEKQEINSWLVKDYYKLNLDRNKFEPKRIITFTGVKNEFDEKRDIFIDISKNIFELVNSSVLNSNSKKVVVDDGNYAVNDVREAYDDYEIGNAPLTVESSEISLSEKKIKNYYNNELKIVQNKIILYKKNNRNLSDTKEIEIPMSFEKASIQEVYYADIESDDEVNNYKQFVLYEHNGKYGAVLSDKIILPAKYSSISCFYVYKYDETKLNMYTSYFLVSLLDKKANTEKFGTIDMNGNIVIPIIYDEINYNFTDEYDNPSSKRKAASCETWRVKKDNKYGIISQSNQIILPVEYDFIERNKINFLNYEDDFISIKKGNLFGFINGEIKKENIIEPIFPRKVGYYVRDYQGVNDLYIFGLTNDDNTTYCLARKDGFLYYQKK